MNRFLYSLLYVLLITFALTIISDAFSSTCQETLDSCEEAVNSQEATIRICEETHKKKDELINSVKENAAATEKSLDTQKAATKAGFSLSGLLLLLLLL